MSTPTLVHSQDPHGHGHKTDPHQQHHFATMEQQADTTKLGMWLFLSTEILLFGGLFVGFGMMQSRYPQEFVEAHEHLQRPLGSLNTIVLLISSWTMVMAVLSAKKSEAKKTVRYLLVTIVCACIFLGIKGIEYTTKFNEGLYPGHWYRHQVTDTIANSHGYSTFFAFYFMMTGLHGIHILVGIILLAWLARRAARGDFSKAYYTPMVLVGLFWHLVDMIWIYLFPLFYLIK